MSWWRYVGGLSPGPAAIPNPANPSGLAARLLRTRPACRGWAGAVARASRFRVVPQPVPHRPAARRRVAVHDQVPWAVLARGPRRRAVARHPRHRDQARPPLVPVRAPLRVAPPVRSPRPLASAPFRQALAFSADNPGMRPRCWTCGRFVGACRECGARYCKRCQPMQHEHGWEPKRQHEQVRRRSLRRLLGGHLRP